MSARCQITGRTVGFGKAVSHSHRRTRRRWPPNIQLKALLLTVGGPPHQGAGQRPRNQGHRPRRASRPSSRGSGRIRPGALRAPSGLIAPNGGDPVSTTDGAQRDSSNCQAVFDRRDRLYVCQPMSLARTGITIP